MTAYNKKSVHMGINAVLSPLLKTFWRRFCIYKDMAKHLYRNSVLDAHHAIFSRST